MTQPAPAKPLPRRVFPFRISQAGIDAVKAAAASEGITPSEWIRRAIAERHQRHQHKPASGRATTRRSEPDAAA